MFLVSAMREAYVQSGDPHEAVIHGFRASARVVTAAALIMTSVFVAFIPNGSSTIQPIALGLAVGVFVDAFVVRMTLVPAVLVLLGRGAWWLPRALDRWLPEVDVEGAALHRKVEFETWEADHGTVAVLATDLVVHEGDEPVQLSAGPAEVTRVRGGHDLALVLSGRGRAHSGQVVVDGLLLPEQREAVNRAATTVDLRGPGLTDTVADTIRDRARLLSFSRHERRAYAARAGDLLAELSVAVGPSSGALEAALVECALAMASHAEVLVLVGHEVLVEPDQARVGVLAAEIARHGRAVVLVGGGRLVARRDGWRTPRRAARPGRRTATTERGRSDEHERHRHRRTSSVDEVRRTRVAAAAARRAGAGLVDLGPRAGARQGAGRHRQQRPDRLEADHRGRRPCPDRLVDRPLQGRPEARLEADRQRRRQAGSAQRGVLRRPDHPLGLLRRDRVDERRQPGARQADPDQQRGREHDAALHQRAGRGGRGDRARQPVDAGLPEERVRRVQPDRAVEPEGRLERGPARRRHLSSSPTGPPSSTPGRRHSPPVSARWPPAPKSCCRAPRPSAAARPRSPAGRPSSRRAHASCTREPTSWPAAAGPWPPRAPTTPAARARWRGQPPASPGEPTGSRRAQGRWPTTCGPSASRARPREVRPPSATTSTGPATGPGCTPARRGSWRGRPVAWHVRTMSWRPARPPSRPVSVASPGERSRSTAPVAGSAPAPGPSPRAPRRWPTVHAASTQPRARWPTGPRRPRQPAPTSPRGVRP